MMRGYVQWQPAVFSVSAKRRMSHAFGGVDVGGIDLTKPGGLMRLWINENYLTVDQVGRNKRALILFEPILIEVLAAYRNRIQMRMRRICVRDKMWYVQHNAYPLLWGQAPVDCVPAKDFPIGLSAVRFDRTYAREQKGP